MSSKGILWTSACALAVAGLLIWLASPSASAAPDSAALEQHRNLGKAFFENPTTHEEAIAEFKKALDLAPNSVREKLNYGLAQMHGNRVLDGVALLEQVQKLDPALPHTWFNLGIYYKKAGQLDKAQVEFEQMVKLTPNEPIAHYQLGTLLPGLRIAMPEAIQECEKSRGVEPATSRPALSALQPLPAGEPPGGRREEPGAVSSDQEADGRRGDSGGHGLLHLRGDL